MLNVAVNSRGSPHVIVVGNEKGGSGKTTIAMHIAVALMKSGQRLATIDLDSRQRTLTHYIENRRAWARRCHVDLELPTHLAIARAEGSAVSENEAAEFADFDQAVSAIERHHDFVVIDTPPHDSYLMRLAHSVTDTLVTPLNDSFLDLDVLAKIDPMTSTVTGVSHYAELVREMRRHRRSVDGDPTDWVVVRNRVSPFGSPIEAVFCNGLQELALALGFRAATGLCERPVYRDLFPRGLTALDVCDRAPAGDLDPSHSVARREIQALLDVLKLPLDDRGRRRAAARAEWLAARTHPLDTGDVVLTDA
ncbi:chromosome partitioning protein [Bradyrhizobium lablabi]|uniref:Chromosome partitioning protein n=1 Tax=Bradyrhizobium lablabi TaxID=722472 RepID=A0A1M6Q2H9_9BRAD|nr:division plane positioning ATPase MipZ [Bradyrhizobium lablabi]SHK14410.1 chromosome partitioning protein [Bradyrhizobium lablabi]